MESQFDPSSLPAAAQTCFNRLTYGATAQELFLPEENPADYYALLDQYFSDYRPALAEHAALVSDLTHARWMLCRRQRAHARIEFHVQDCVKNPADWLIGEYHRFELADRYKTQAERALQRALSNVRAVKKDEENSTKWRAHHKLAEANAKRQEARHKVALARAARRAVIEDAQAARVERSEALRREREDLLREVEKRQQPVQFDEHGAFLLQDLYISSNHDGQPVVDAVSPSNAEIRSRIAKRSIYPTPPVEVVRHYHFHGKLPPGYEWTLPDEQMRRDWINPAVKVALSFDEWRSHADHEDALNLHPPEPKEPEDN